MINYHLKLLPGQASGQGLHQLILFLLVIIISWTTELFSMKESPTHKWRHGGTNLLFILTALPLQLMMSVLVVAVLIWTNDHQWGLAWQLPFHGHPLWYYISLFFFLDLGEYIYHRLMHSFSPFWKFHLVHHSDLHVDVSTTVREHPVETVVRNGFLIIWVYLLGPNLIALLIRQAIQSTSNILSHTELRLPSRLNKWLSLLLVTPNSHHVHHHYRLPFTDSNYGDVLSVWDRLFGTYAELPSGDTVFGVDTHMDKTQTGTFWKIVLMPFNRSGAANFSENGSSAYRKKNGVSNL